MTYTALNNQLGAARAEARRSKTAMERVATAQAIYFKTVASLDDVNADSVANRRCFVKVKTLKETAHAS